MQLILETVNSYYDYRVLIFNLNFNKTFIKDKERF